MVITIFKFIRILFRPKSVQDYAQRQPVGGLLLFLTQVGQKLHGEVHVEFVGIHVLQGVAGPVTEVVQVGAQSPARTRVPRNRLLRTTEHTQACQAGPVQMDRWDSVCFT